MPIQDELKQYQRINYLEKGDIFGEISCMTKLERTCTIVTRENTMVHCLKREGLEIIQEMYPKIYNSIYDKMRQYEDEDMIQRFKVISNIPLFRGLSDETIYQIIWQIDEKINLTSGEYIIH
jgi:CRP-like cAMP-binding protein